jgi:hypothetical protein
MHRKRTHREQVCDAIPKLTLAISTAMKSRNFDDVKTIQKALEILILFESPMKRASKRYEPDVSEGLSEASSEFALPSRRPAYSQETQERIDKLRNGA